jgi:hypothetical protein
MEAGRMKSGWRLVACIAIAAGSAHAQTSLNGVPGVGEASAASAASAPSNAVQPRAMKPDALLAIDQNRATVITRIVSEWGDKLAIETGMRPVQLREMLSAMRADQLFAASMAGSLSGLQAVVSQALAGASRLEVEKSVQVKALGSATQDLVYTPVTPCRLFDTRASQGGLGTPLVNTPRTYGAITPVANQGGPGGCAAGASATVALVVMGTLTPSGSGLLQSGPQGGAPFPNALILYQAGDQYDTTAAIPLNPANGRFDIVEQFAQADVYGDLLGYFSPPAATALDCVTVDFAGTGTANLPSNSEIDITTAAACTAGYTAVSISCEVAGFSPAGLALTQSGGSGAFFACIWRNQSGATLDYRDFHAHTRCCRVPGH